MSLEQRLAALEAEVASLRFRLKKLEKKTAPQRG